MVDEGISPTCFKIQVGSSFDKLDESMIMEYRGERTLASRAVNHFHAELPGNIDWTAPEDRLFKAYSSDEFGGLTPSILCTNDDWAVGGGHFDLGAYNNDSHTLLETLLKLSTRPYEELKEEFNVPSDIDFSVTLFPDLGGEILIIKAPEDIPSSRSVYSEDVHLTYVNQTASILTGKLNFKVW